MVTSEQPIASSVGVQILKEGGSAVDAAIAVSAVLGLAEPMLAGLGSDSFAIIWDPKTHKLYGYNGSGWSPQERSYDRMVTDVENADKRAKTAEHGKVRELTIPSRGELSVTVPGTVDAWVALHKKFGKLPLATDLAPAIKYSLAGIPVTELMSRQWAYDWRQLEKNPYLQGELGGFKKVFLIDGATPKEGQLFTNKAYARLLERIASGGRAAFYEGRTASAMVAYLNKEGPDAEWSYADFSQYHGAWVRPESIDYRGYNVYELPPNGQGFAVLEMLNVLDGYNLAKMGYDSPDMLMAELGAERLAFADLSKWYADPKFYRAPLTGLLSPEYANARRKLLDLEQANPHLDAGDPMPYDRETTNFATADDSGMMVSYIQSNSNDFGSGLVSSKLGFAFQDRGAGFSLNKNFHNAYGPRKRPFQTIIPAFVLKNGEPWMAFSVMGGFFQTQGQMQILVNMIDFGMNVQAAGDAARWVHLNSKQFSASMNMPNGQATNAGIVEIEPGYSDSTITALRHRGYSVVVRSPTALFGVGGYEAIRFHPSSHTYWGATEFRKDGEAVGY